MEDLYINFPTHIQQDTKYLSKKSWARQTYSTCDTDLATLCLKLEYLVTLCLKLECWLTRYLTREINGCSSCALRVHQACKKRYAITNGICVLGRTVFGNKDNFCMKHRTCADDSSFSRRVFLVSSSSLCVSCASQAIERLQTIIFLVR
jgi:hypothetical protein